MLPVSEQRLPKQGENGWFGTRMKGSILFWLFRVFKIVNCILRKQIKNWRKKKKAKLDPLCPLGQSCWRASLSPAPSALHSPLASTSDPGRIELTRPHTTSPTRPWTSALAHPSTCVHHMTELTASQTRLWSDSHPCQDHGWGERNITSHVPSLPSLPSWSLENVGVNVGKETVAVLALGLLHDPHRDARWQD